jgi:hypothetical protein
VVRERPTNNHRFHHQYTTKVGAGQGIVTQAEPKEYGEVKKPGFFEKPGF